MVIFHWLGNWPVCRNKFTIFVITGRRTSRQLTRRRVGIGSRGHDFFAADSMSARISVSVRYNLNSVIIIAVLVECN